jgi:hypothetical protein
MKQLLARVLVLFFVSASLQASASGNILPPEVDAALSAPDSVVLYSLEPLRRSDVESAQFFHHVKVLGSVKLEPAEAAAAVGAFRDAVSSWNNLGVAAACFDPRHALSVRSRGHAYDLLLCYQCSQLEILRDGHDLAWLGVAGSADLLNAMLTSRHIPLAKPPGS